HRSERVERANGLRRAVARQATRRRAARAAADLMNPEALAVLIPIVAIGGFFALMIVRTLTKAYTAKLQAGSQGGPPLEASAAEVATALEQLRREVAELAGRVERTERLPAQ